jgi:hypothetical protein
MLGSQINFLRTAISEFFVNFKNLSLQNKGQEKSIFVGFHEKLAQDPSFPNKGLPGALS